VLGPQGAREKAIDSDPNKVRSYEPPARPMAAWLNVFGAASFAVVAAFIALSPNAGILERLMLGAGAGFFAFAAYVGAKRARGCRPVSLETRGLWFDGPRARKLIAWDNIEDISTGAVSGQKFTLIALRNPSDLVAQYDQVEAREAVGQENVFGFFARAVGASTGGAASDLSAVFANRRKQFGGEVWLTPEDRDREAEEFEMLLRAWWEKHQRP